MLLGDGKGNIVASYDLGAAADRSYSGRLVDLDGDGDLDVVISNDAPDPKLVYLNDGRGHFQVGSAYGDPKWETRNATVADVNGDGLPDIIAANRSDSSANYICLNRGKGIFDSNYMAFSRESATTITAADFNKDGLIDLAVPHRDRGQSYVYLNGPKGVFADTRRVPFGPARRDDPDVRGGGLRRGRSPDRRWHQSSTSFSHSCEGLSQRQYQSRPVDIRVRGRCRSGREESAVAGAPKPH